mmetsp:Transcript_60425/g.112213  ORF Transcript_60425/g.112213 Transcript_60425/m.112213 type:complete len:417 (-) Transcript_60425:64-1314(-)
MASAFRIGDRVEVPYEGQWYAGQVVKLDEATGQAGIQCDTDAPGLITQAPLQSLRTEGAATQGQQQVIDPSRITITRLRLPTGETFLVCPICDKQFDEQQGETKLLCHVAADHGKAWSSQDGQHGDSEHLDMLHQASATTSHPRCEEVKQRMQVVSLGSFCGVKFTIQRLGLGAAHMPFDWIRTRSSGVVDFLTNGFAGFFSVASQCQIKSANLRVYRSHQHSFWHDDISQTEVREKLLRRIDRFRALQKDSSKDVLFIRSCASTDELSEVEQLYMTLQSWLGVTRRVLLVIIIDGQEQHVGPFFLEGLPGVVLYGQPIAGEDAMMEGRAFETVVRSSIDLALQASNGKAFPVVQGAMTFKKASDMLAGGLIRHCDAGFSSGYEGLRCFEETPGIQHFDLTVSDATVLPDSRSSGS